MTRGKKINFLYLNTVLCGELENIKGGIYFIKKKTKKGKYTKIYNVKPEFIVTKIEVSE